MRISPSIRPLVVQLDDGEVLGQERHSPQDAGAERGMLFDQFELLSGQGVRLAQDVIADADLTDVVEQRAKSQYVEVLGGKTHLPSDRDRDRADPLGMAGGVRVAGVERQRQRPDRADIGALRFRLGCGDGFHHRVEGPRQRIDFEAGPRGGQRAFESP